MYFTEGRIKRLVKEVQQSMTPERIEIREFRIRRGPMPPQADPAALLDGWQDYSAGTLWAGSSDDQYALFHVQLTVPAAFAGKKVLLGVKTNRDGWNALNPQMLLYVNGQVRQGLDTNHLDSVLSERAEAGAVYDIFLYAFSGIGGDLYHREQVETDVRLYAELKTADPLLEDLFYNLDIPLKLLPLLPPDSADYWKILNALNEAVNLLDMRLVGSPAFLQTAGQANAFLKTNLFGAGQGPNATVTCVGHTHIDVAWLWRYCHTREKTVRSFATVLKLMEEYPEYVFMSSQPQLYAFLKEDHPEVYARVKARVAEGRWEAEGGMWVEADTNIPSGESLVRQFLFGKRFFREEFGVDNKMLWLPDVFGYNGNLPQIMKKSGIDYFMTAKLANNEYNKFPYHTFSWKGIDGTEVLTQLMIYGAYGYNGKADAQDLAQGWNRYAQKEINNEILLSVGFGDGGGGTTPEMIESIRRYTAGMPGAPKAEPGSARRFFDRLADKVGKNRRLPKWVGELYYENHRGTYTSMAKNKKNNRQAEFLYLFAEQLAAFSALLRRSAYPAAALRKGWQGILLNQFHDVLPGSSIKAVYDDTDLLYAQILADGRQILDDGLDRIAAAVAADAPSLVVFNPLSWERNGLVSFRLPAGAGTVALQDDAGALYACQKTGRADGTWLAYVQRVAAKGYTRYTIVGEPESAGRLQNGPSLAVNAMLLENDFFRIELDDRGVFTRLYDKRARRDVLKPGERGNVLQVFEDKPRREDNWNLDPFYSEKMWEIDDAVRVEVVETGPVRGILAVTRRFLNSTLEQQIILYRDLPRIDFRTTIDWREKDLVLKAAFPAAINADKATYEIQFGHIERNTHANTSWDAARFEVCGHKWADLSEYGYGLSLLNDCKYGYDIKDGCLRLTLLRCGTIPNPAADKEVHELTYAIYPHQGSWQEGGTLQAAYDLNCPLACRQIGRQPGELPASLALVAVDQENVVVETVKQAEDGDAYIIRVYEAYNRRSEVVMRFCRPIETFGACNLIEQATVEEDPIRVDSDSFSFSIKPLEIRTFKVGFRP